MDAEERADRARPALWIGVAGAVLSALYGMLGPHDGSLLRAPAVLEARVESALAAAGYPGVDVVTRGQDAVLAGVVRAREDIAAASAAALTAAGRGGPWAGGVTSVKVEELAVGAFEAPFSWRAARSEGRVTLSGAVPSTRARNALAERARAVFPNAELVDDMHVAGGAPSANWTDVAEQAITNLVALGNGQARFVGDRIVIIGDGAADAVEALRRAYANPPPPFSARIEASIAGRGVGIEELQGVDLSTGDPRQCETAFARLMDANTINFASGSAEIDASSMELIRDLGSVALRCDGSVIEVAGHTDNEGARALNMALSQSRADAVVAALAAQGVAADRLRGAGYGPDRPRASNRTASGRAANRRIEFTIESQTP